MVLCGNGVGNLKVVELMMRKKVDKDTIPTRSNSRDRSPVVSIIPAEKDSGNVVLSYFTCSSPQLDQVQESARPQKNYRRTIHGKGGECSFCWH
ncbi:hypothetical protein AVEN_1327-1 [Araneus ventricosus]|uniref:Uncharacterized protein n=1 Tax=Araneus ventricosus TaxID=182803 RepID=A0A4Y2D2J9_ARAVE|nr:hypothetical protein AVEN_1327-1 [Araneus ventricosus]